MIYIKQYSINNSFFIVS